MSKRIWAVSHGEYSDYSVMCVCESEATAQKVLAAYNGREHGCYDDARIEEMLCLTDGDDPLRITTYQAEAILWDTGEIREPRYWDYQTWNFESTEPTPLRTKWEYVRAPILNNQGGYLRLIGADQQAVAKVMTDRLAAFNSGSWMPHRNHSNSPPAA